MKSGRDITVAVFNKKLKLCCCNALIVIFLTQSTKKVAGMSESLDDYFVNKNIADGVGGLDGRE